MTLNNAAHHFPLIALDAEMNTVSRFKTGKLAVNHLTSRKKLQKGTKRECCVP
jgi:hypothetical protein